MRITTRYFKAKLIVSLLLAIISGGIFYLLDFPLYGFLGIVLGVCNIVPVFGAWVAALVICLILLFYQPIWALYALFVILGLQIVEQFVLTPLIMKKAIDLKPLVIIAVVMAAGLLTGFWGMVFALPLAAIIKLGYDLFFHRDYPGE